VLARPKEPFFVARATQFMKLEFAGTKQRHCLGAVVFLCGPQGDQIGRIFANWTIVNLGQLFGNNGSSPRSWIAFLQSKSYVAILTKNELGYILGDFLTNSSGHP
jgi:hypothetical protein